MSDNLLELARKAVALAQAKGADQAAAAVSRQRDVEVRWRDGKIERLAESTTRGMGLQLYVGGRYSAVETSDLRPEALERFVDESVALARALARDQYRALPDPSLYAGRAALDLQISDPVQPSVTIDQRRLAVQRLEAAARDVPGADRILSVTTECMDGESRIARVHSNGFEGTSHGTWFAVAAEVSVRDPDGRKPEEGDFAQARFQSDLPEVGSIGRVAAEKALGRIGAKKGASAVLPVVINNRSAGRFLSYFLGPLSAASVQQKRSMFEGMVGKQIASPLLELHDEPHVVRGLGSRLFDGEGIAARRFPLVEAGVLRNLYVDNYYGRKLGLTPTTSRTSNLSWKLGPKSGEQLLAEIKDGLLVTGFLGGNSNGTTGDFSLGIQGFRIRNGARAEPFSEMNLSGNHLELWNRLVAVGSDPYPYSPLRCPTLVFDAVQIAGA